MIIIDIIYIHCISHFGKSMSYANVFARISALAWYKISQTKKDTQ